MSTTTFSGLPHYAQLTETNYADWSVNTKALLQLQKLWRLVNGTQTKPSPPSTPTDASIKAEEDWEDRSECTCGILMMSLSPGQKTHTTTVADNPVEIWKALKKVHESQEPANRYNAYDDLFSVRKRSDKTLPALIMRTEQIVHLIKNL